MRSQIQKSVGGIKKGGDLVVKHASSLLIEGNIS